MQSGFGLPNIQATLSATLGSNQTTSAETQGPPFHVPNNDDHERISALFIGPKGENLDTLQKCFDMIVRKQGEARNAYYPDDKPFVSDQIIASSSYKDSKQKIEDTIYMLTDLLNEKSIPFYSPRYAGHMCMDMSLPAILGYLAAMIYNPNNVAFEASPITTHLELLVGLQMSEMLGYNIDTQHPELPLGWGHITCDGSIANLEAVWCARNLKFYPLSLRDAMAPGAELDFVADTFIAENCKGESKLLKDFSTWELLNMKVRTILEIPGRLGEEYGISSKFLENVMKKYIAQSNGKDAIERRWNIEKPIQFCVTQSKHYSWPKAAAIAGIGSDNIVDIPIDADARCDTEALEAILQGCLEREQAVYAVVAVIGSTEEGAVDPLGDIVDLRNKFREKGLSFVVHADAAWGGYFASMIPKRAPTAGSPRNAPRQDSDFVPHVGLRPRTAAQLARLCDADSITLDPHKSGYVPYPAGGLCYRDGRMRYLLTWVAPYINNGSGESIGVYGVEGSKPGAAAAAVWAAHEVVGLDPSGHGTLLGEAMFTCRRWASHWSAMSDDKTSFIVVPFNRLPSELKPNSTPEDVLQEKQRIRDLIINKTNEQIAQSPEAMELLQGLGSDLNINAFACNFRYPDGRLNTDIEEANFLNRRIFERLSVTEPSEDPREVPLYLTSTTFAQADYKECATHFKQRLGLVGNQDLLVLRNVVMNPFTTSKDFMKDLAKIFQEVLEEEVLTVRERNEAKPEKHTFLLQGQTARPYFIHLPNFYKETDRYQFIFSADVSEAAVQAAAAARKADITKSIIVENAQPMELEDIAKGKSFEAVLKQNGIELQKFTVSNIAVVKKRSLDLEDWDKEYPSRQMPFYLYGSQKEHFIEHALLLAPNIQLSAAQVQVDLKDPLSDQDLRNGVFAFATNVHEASMQPFPKMKDLPKGDKFFFHTGKQLTVDIYRDPHPVDTEDPISLSNVTDLITSGTITLGEDLYIDSECLNNDGQPQVVPYRFNQTGSVMSSANRQKWTDIVEHRLGISAQFGDLKVDAGVGVNL